MLETKKGAEMETELMVVKRNGKKEIVSFDKILKRLRTMGEMTPRLSGVIYTNLAMKVIEQLCNDITTSKIDELTAEQCHAMYSIHPDYNTLASRVIISCHQKNTMDSFSKVMKKLYDYKDKQGKSVPLVRKEVYWMVKYHAKELDKMCDYSRDFLLDYFGFKTLERSYLKAIQKVVVERPQHMWLRVAIGIHCTGLKAMDIENLVVGEEGGVWDKVRETYELMSQKYFTHATPTLYNAGTPMQQLSSCYLLQMESDSLDGIFNTLKECAQISKGGGGIGLNIHNIRATGSHIRGTDGYSNGIVPMLRVFNNTARYVDQGGGKRKGSFAIYLEPWHADIELFLAMKRNQGNEELKARDLFYALWIPDLFMKRVKSDGMWTLFCPDEAPGLADVAGGEFDELYCRYEEEGRGRKAVKAQEIWVSILDSQMETGNPYLLYKDSANAKSNQSNLGVIKSSNLCTEILQYTSSEETAVCNLASIALPSFVVESPEDGSLSYDYAKLRKVARVITYNLNRVIDINEYPSEKARKSNMRHRPIGLGVQGLADVYMRMGMAFTSDEAKDMNRRIFETIYLGAVEESMHLGDKYGCYETFIGSPASRGLLQFDLWEGGMDGCAGGLMWRDEWLALKKRLVYAGKEGGSGGLRNSLLLAPMPTASTSQILGFNECFEPITSNFYVRKTLAGNFVIANRYLVQDLISVGMWNERVKNSIIANNGSVQHLDLSGVEGGDKIKEKYRTVWEISMKHLIDMSAERGRFVCQSQSLNLWQEKATRASLTSMHFYAWSRGLKTGLYYLHTLAKAQTQQFSIEPTAAGGGNNEAVEEHGVCENCSA